MNLYSVVTKKIEQDEPIKLHLGCGEVYLEGWINCDLYSEKADVKFDAASIALVDNLVDEIYASHLIEHFDFQEGQRVLREWYRVLKEGGKLTVETPDLFHTCKRFVEGDEQFRIRLYGHLFAWPWSPGQIHKFLYTEVQLGWTLEQIGFKNLARVSPDSIYAQSMPGFEDLYLKMEAFK